MLFFGGCIFKHLVLYCRWFSGTLPPLWASLVSFLIDVGVILGWLSEAWKSKTPRLKKTGPAELPLDVDDDADDNIDDDNVDNVDDDDYDYVDNVDDVSNN